MLKRTRFSLATLLLLTTACVAGLAIWKAFIYEPPTHRIPLYEKAPGTRRGAIMVGPNLIRLRVVARNDRDGSVIIEDGLGNASAATIKNKKELATASPWLDVVQIKLNPTPDRVDIIEARIFDHKQRKLISEVDPAFGWRVVESDLVQIYGLGKKLPRELDVWLRAHSYRQGDPVANIASTSGSVGRLPQATLTLEDIRAGMCPYSGGQLQEPDNEETHRLSALFVRTGSWQPGKIQIAAVSKSGRKRHTDVPHFLSFSTGQDVKQPMTFDMPLDELDHFEIRAFGGRERFFFEAVTLPQVSRQAFAKPPIATVTIAGQEKEVALAEFAPLDFRISTRRGEWASGTAASDLWAAVTPADTARNRDTTFTLIYRSEGLRNPTPQLRFTDTGTNKPIPPSEMPRQASGTANGASFGAGFFEWQMPLERVGSVEIELGR